MPDGIKGIDKKNLPLMDMGKTIGTNGETFMRIVTNGYTNKLISAYPIP